MEQVLSIEEKARLYDEAIEVARKYRNDCKRNRWVTECMENIFPKLRESEDERIRKELLEHCKNQAKPYTQTGNKCPQIQSWINWLEKQGVQKTIDEIAKEVCKDKASTVAFLKSTGIMNEKGELAEQYRQDEQNHTDKTEPKFNVGDWVVDEVTGSVYQIKNCIENTSNYKFGYELTNGGYIGSGAANHFHLWTIDDAYEFDFEKKELKKVVPIFNIGDTIIKKHNSDIYDFGSFIITDITGGKYWYNDRIICDIIEQDEWEIYESVRQNPSWSEEDENMLNKNISFLSDMLLKD